MRIVLTGGGTGGHVSTQVALLEELAKFKQVKTLYIGSKSGMESRIIPDLGVDFVGIQAGKLRRYPSWRNLASPFAFVLGCFSSLRILGRYQPDVVFSTGGYVALPVVLAAWLRHIPLVVHEQTARLGLANRISARSAKKILLSYPKTARDLPFAKVTVTGNPVRSLITGGSKKKALELLDFTASLPTVFVLGGAQGAHFLNLMVEMNLEKWLSFCQLVIVTGQKGEQQHKDFEILQNRRNNLTHEQKKRLRIFDYIHTEIGDIYALADLVISRSGAGTIAELLALRKPSILIPLPESADSEQHANAAMLSHVQGAILVRQTDYQETEESLKALCLLASTLLADKQRLIKMSENLLALPYNDPRQPIVREIFKYAKKSRDQNA